MDKLSPIFIRDQFELCDVPVPKGYPQSQTHVGVSQRNGKVYLTSSPFPELRQSKFVAYAKAIIRKCTHGMLFKIVRAESYENPLLYVSTNEHGSCFMLMQSKPLMEQPDPIFGYPAFNSDPDIFIEGGKAYILNRAIFRTKLTPGRFRDEYCIRVYLIEGSLDGNRFNLNGINLINESDKLSVSPCLVKYQEKYRYFELFTNCYNDGNSFDGLKYKTFDTIDQLKTKDAQWKTVCINEYEYLPWHMSVFEYDGKLYSVLACVKKGEPKYCYQLLGEFSSTLDKLTIYNKPLTDYNSYRGHAYVDDNGFFHLYTTTVREKLHNGKSVDGREILTASMNFEDLLKQVRQ